MARRGDGCGIALRRSPRSTAKADAYAAARAAAADAARAGATRLAASPAAAAARIRSTLADALAAHYEFESARPAQLDGSAAAAPAAHSACRR